MNFCSENIKNCLFVPKNLEYDDELYGSLLKLVPFGKIVLVITRAASSPELLPLMEQTGMQVYNNKQSLRQFFFICTDNIVGVIKILFDLHRWTFKPHIIVLDLNTFNLMGNENTHILNDMCKDLTSGTQLKHVIQCIATLFNKMNLLNNMHSDAVEDQTKSSKLFSIVVLPKYSRLLTDKDIQLIIEIFYSDNTYEDFSNIFELMYSTVSPDKVM
ncbi:uncharacterized protein LOC105228889 [Bactrocera dorsalis]|uniref:Uncharacterized protein LOC105228889 n=1 Tax=Bactrocera dorsalis TaxID=27457 RepID=A0A6I9VCA1_BACDO|nr:uncharacterized protein LOC105228889 [Bactrocera dorsalis]